MGDKLTLQNGELLGNDNLPILEPTGGRQGHFKTNFSVEQKSDDLATEYDHQQSFQRIPYGTDFTKVRQAETFLHIVDTILVPCQSPEIDTSGGTWSLSAASNIYKFGQKLANTTNGEFLEFEFSGVAVDVACSVVANRSIFKAQIKVKGAGSFDNEKRFTIDSAVNLHDQLFQLYTGLPYNTYVVRLTHIDTDVEVNISHFSYTTYMIQRPVTQKYVQTGPVGEQTVNSFLSNVINVTINIYENGHRVQFVGSGSVPSGLDKLTEYYVINKGANDFQVSLTEAGAAVTFSDDGAPSNVNSHFSVSNCPPMTPMFTGGPVSPGADWVELNASIFRWNSAHFAANDTEDGAYVEFKFYGSKCWVSTFWNEDANVDVTVFIDGVQTAVRFNTYNTDTGSTITPDVAQDTWIRLDDDTLTEGFHIIKLLMPDPFPATEFQSISGFAFYSGDIVNDTTIKRSLILGSDSFAVGIDDSGFTDSGGFTIAESTVSFLRRHTTKAAALNDFIKFTTPNNTELKAIYYISSSINSADRGIIEFTLAGAKRRRLDMSVASFTQHNLILQIYDKFHDGDLHNQVLQAESLESKVLTCEGLIFEIGDPVTDNAIYCMPKWTRFQGTANFKNAVSATQRLDVFGVNIDLNEGRLPMIHTGWLNNGTVDAFFRHGCGFVVREAAFEMSFAIDPIDSDTTSVFRGGEVAAEIASMQIIERGDPGLGHILYSNATFDWAKARILLPRVV